MRTAAQRRRELDRRGGVRLMGYLDGFGSRSASCSRARDDRAHRHGPVREGLRAEAREARAPPRPPRPQPLRGRHGEVHRLRAVRRRVPGPLHLRARRRQPARRPGVARASATASSTRSTTCAASTATCAWRRAPPRRSPSRSCSSSPSPTARTPSTRRPSCVVDDDGLPAAAAVGGLARPRRRSQPTRRPGCGPPRRPATPTTRARSRGRASSASA